MIPKKQLNFDRTWIRVHQYWGVLRSTEEFFVISSQQNNMETHPDALDNHVTEKNNILFWFDLFCFVWFFILFYFFKFYF